MSKKSLKMNIDMAFRSFYIIWELSSLHVSLVVDNGISFMHACTFVIRFGCFSSRERRALGDAETVRSNEFPEARVRNQRKHQAPLIYLTPLLLLLLLLFIIIIIIIIIISRCSRTTCGAVAARRSHF